MSRAVQTKRDPWDDIRCPVYGKWGHEDVDGKRFELVQFPTIYAHEDCAAKATADPSLRGTGPYCR
jgi:hypothetical protein